MHSNSALVALLLAAGVAAQDFTGVPAANKLNIDGVTWPGLWQTWPWGSTMTDSTSTVPPPPGLGLKGTTAITWTAQWGGGQFHIVDATQDNGNGPVNPQGIDISTNKWTAMVGYFKGNTTFSKLQFEIHHYNKDGTTSYSTNAFPLTRFTNATLSPTQWTQVVIPMSVMPALPAGATQDTFWFQSLDDQAATTLPTIQFAGFFTNASLSALPAGTTTTTVVNASPTAAASSSTTAAAAGTTTTTPAAVAGTTTTTAAAAGTTTTTTAAASASASPSTGAFGGSARTGSVGWAVMAATTVLVVMAGLL